MDAWFEGGFTEANRERWNRELASVYNRGFWDGYYLGRKLGEWAEQYGSLATKRKVYVGKVTNYFSRVNVAEIKMETRDLQVGDSIMIIGPTTGVYEDRVPEIRVDMKNVEAAVKGDDCSIPVRELERRGDKVYKVVDAGLPGDPGSN